MANIEHVSITDPDIHEPKGASTAASGTVYVADGAGSGAWTAGLNKYAVHTRIGDISTADQEYIPVPLTGTIIGIYTCLGGAISGSDATITVKTSAGTVGTVTVAQSGSAAGDVDSTTSGLSNTSVTAGDYIEIETDGASTGNQPVAVSVVIQD